MTGETRFEELKRYVALSAADAALLRSFRDHAAPHFERIAQEFYDRIRQHEDAHAVFAGEAQISRLQRSLVRWMERLFSGAYDEAYFAETTTIGRVHVRVGLPQRYMFTAMALIRSSLTQIAEARPVDGSRVADVLSRLLDLELAIMLESYHDDFIARIQHLGRLEKQALGDSLARTEHRYVNAVEFARVVIVGLDTLGVIHLFNREAERVTGFARDEVLGRPLIDVLFGDDTVDAGRPGGLVDLQAILADFAARPPPPSAQSAVTRMLETAVRTRSRQARVVQWALTHAPASPDDVSVFAIGRDSTDERVLLERTKQQAKLAAIEALADAGDGGRITLRARRQPHTVTVDVEDDGPGIAPGTPIFDAFFSTKAQGTGLGLSISYRIISDHGGALAFESVAGRTVFHIVLPIDGPHLPPEVH